MQFTLFKHALEKKSRVVHCYFCAKYNKNYDLTKFFLLHHLQVYLINYDSYRFSSSKLVKCLI